VRTPLSSWQQSFQQSEKEVALELIAKSPEVIKQMQAAYNQHFPTQTVSAVMDSFSAESLLRENPICQSVVRASLDALDEVIVMCCALERYIQLTIPKTEDGGNFGVGIQIEAANFIGDYVAVLDARAEDLLRYAAARADALEKCKLPGTVAIKSSTTKTSDSEGADLEKGPIKANETKRMTEEKSVDTATNSVETHLRKQAVVAIDVRFYRVAKKTYADTILALLAVVDFMDKNKVKIATPKGDAGSAGMY
jgi:Proteasome activator pa28 beta subunit